MSAQEKTDDNPVLKISNILPRVIGLLPQLPSIASNIRKILSLKAEDHISLGSILEKNAQKFQNSTALLYENQRYSYKEFNETVNQYAHYFLDKGLSKGETVVVFIENRPEILFMIAAMAKIGGVASLINPNQRESVLEHSINLDRGKHFVIGEEIGVHFEAIRDKLALEADAQLYWAKDHGQQAKPEHYIDLKEAIQDYSKENPSTTSSIQAGQRYANVFTSGTTGLPKASVQTHKKWIQTYYWFGKINLRLNSSDVMYIPIPFFHTNALIVGWPSVSAGGAAIAMRRKLSVSNFWKDVEKFNVSSFIYIGEVCRYLLNAPPSDKEKNHRVKKIIGNGLRPDIWKAFKERFNIPKIYEFYGASDGNVSFTNTLNLDSCVGWSTTKYAIVKYDVENDQPFRNAQGFFEKVPKGDIGLLISEINHKVAFDGYVNKENNEQKIFRGAFAPEDTWFNTGDLMRDIGFRHAQFVDRMGDTFRWKGENVSTIEVESIANQSSDISNCTAYGVQIPNSDGRAGMLALVTKLSPEEFNWQTFTNQLIQELPSYAVPIFIRFCNDFETTATHKIKKFNLKKEGFQCSDPIYVMLPKSKKYVPLSSEILEEINQGKYAF